MRLIDRQADAAARQSSSHNTRFTADYVSMNIQRYRALCHLNLLSNMGPTQSTKMLPVKRYGWLLLSLNAYLLTGCGDAAISTTLPEKAGCKDVYVVKGVHEQEFYVGSRKAIADCFSDQRDGRDGGHSLTEFLSFPSGNPENNHILFNAVKGSGIKDPYVYTLGL
jgi:hypothetical protein